MLIDLIRLARPKDWVKNAFIFMPLPFAVASGGQLDPVPFALGLFGFCLANSAVYSLNDLLDAERDAGHPKKKDRPVAAGRIPKQVAAFFSLGLVSVGALLEHLTGSRQALAILLVYYALNVFYSWRGKHIALVDVFLLSSGFLLRVLLGCALVGVSASNWLLLCSSALALFLALAKRWGDLAKGLDEDHRPSLAGYTRGFLDQAMGIMSGVTLISYALYCLEAEVLREGREFATMPFVLFGVLEYLRLAHVQEGETGSPVDLLLSSPKIIFSGLGWTAATLWSVRSFF